MSDSNQTGVKEPFEKYCSECGSIINIKAEICPKCGVRQMYPQASNSIGVLADNGKSRFAAFLLALLFGWIGVHKFYLGQIGWGVIYALFFWTGIPAIAGFIECILLITMSDDEFNRRFGQH